MYGEDVDLSYRIKQKGYKIIYYPRFTVLHLKGQSGINKQNNKNQRSETKKHFYEAMKIFYRTHYASQHHAFINSLVYAGIDLKSKL
jgi:GT2 family glycosyltransferase